MAPNIPSKHSRKQTTYLLIAAGVLAITSFLVYRYLFDLVQSGEASNLTGPFLTGVGILAFAVSAALIITLIGGYITFIRGFARRAGQGRHGSQWASFE